MILQEVKLVGFKSFADKTNIKLESGITGIVGPNGSGKSNIADAIRWVLGEQSVKSLRGEGAMIDVVFSGSKSRKGSNSASVALVFDNSDHFFSLDYNEIEIKRVIYLNGENEYFLNKEKCRLKDITDLLMDSGIGKDSFNIISQGNIQDVLSNKPEERRIIFEAAAGVLKYKKRKEEATRRLDKAHDNLNRINDITSELLNQIEPLQEQKEKAEIYVNGKKELESVEIALITDDITEINKDYQNKKNQIEILSKELEEYNNNSVSEDAKLQQLKLEFTKQNTLLHEKQQQLVLATEEVQKLNGERELLTERNKYSASDPKIHNNLLSLKENVLRNKNSITDLEIEIKNCKQEKQQLEDSKNVYSRKFDELQKMNASLLKEYADLSKEQVQMKYQLDVLIESINRNETLPYGAKMVLNNPKLTGVNDIIGNLIEFNEEHSVAIDISLGGAINYVVVDNEKSAKEAINYIKSNNGGRVTFFPLNVIKPRAIDPETMNIVKKEDGYIDIASNLVKYDAKYRNIILNQLGNVLIVDNIDNATRISKLIKNSYRIVTLSGELFGVGGSITGGNNKRNMNVIGQKSKAEQLKINIELADNKINQMNIKKDKIKEEIDVLSSEISKLNERIIALDIICSNKQKEYNVLNDEYKKLDNEYESLKSIVSGNISKKEEELLKKYYDVENSKNAIVREIELLKTTSDNLSDEINILDNNLKHNNSELYKKQNNLKDLEINVNRMDVKLDNLLGTLNEEYGMTYEHARENYALVVPKDEARKRVEKLKRDIKQLGEVNTGSIEEYERVKTRFDFLEKQKNDLYKAEDTLLNIIKEMDAIMKKAFDSSFKKIKVEFKNVFKSLFGGGDADLRLTVPDDLLNTGIDIIAHPPGKQMQHISLLSGGEKALTAISLLFAILKVKPVPFCLLDEVEAPLDEVNVNNFGKYLTNFTEKTQFIVITHKKKTMEYADVLYGITMQESGVSKLVSVKLNNKNEND